MALLARKGFWDFREMGPGSGNQTRATLAEGEHSHHHFGQEANSPSDSLQAGAE